MRVGLLTGFSMHVVEKHEPFISETGTGTFLAFTPHRFGKHAGDILRGAIDSYLKGRVQPTIAVYRAAVSGR